MLDINNVCYKNDNTEILNGISLKVEKGECISIVGASGSGKSTLLKLCADLIPLTNGSIYFQGKNYLEYDPLELRKKISYCVQLPYLFGTTVYENLEFPFKIRKEPFDRYRVIDLLNKFGLEESFLKKDIRNLSGGEKQRVAIIRNLIYVPKVLLLDEATSALDNNTANLVENYIKDLNINGTTVLWITHSLDQSKSIFTRRVIISEGKIEREEWF